MDPKQLIILGAASAAMGNELIVAGLPTEVDGQKVKYYRKEVMKVGEYVHPKKGYSFSVDQDRMDKWVENFRRYTSNGNKPFIPCKHQRFNAKDNFGYVVGLDRQGDSLYATMQLIGDDAHKAATRNNVSIYVEGDVKDGQNTKYDELIEHIAIVPNPVVPGLSGFVPIAASSGLDANDEVPVFTIAAAKDTDMEWTKEQIAAVRKFLGVDDKVAADKLPGLFVEKLGDKAPTLEKLMLSNDKVDEMTTELKTTKEKLTEANRKVVELSNDDQDEDPRVVNLLSKSIDSAKKTAIAAGAVTKAVADKIDTMFRPGGKPNSIALSMSEEDGDPLAVRVFEALAENTIVKPGEKTGKQSRKTEIDASSDDDDAVEQSEIEAADKVAQEMFAGRARQ